MESFNEPEFRKNLKALGANPPGAFIQDNHSCSAKYVLRGLHFQASPNAQGKLVRVISGAALDIAVDIRPDSDTYGQWVSEKLTAENKKMLWIPEGFAHGFLSLEDDTHFLYKTTNVYDKESERSIRWDDPDIGIIWPQMDNLLISEKDQNAPLLKEIESSLKFRYKAGREEISLKVLGDERGSLVSLERGVDIPFDVKRAYYIFNTQPAVSRGFHAHINLQQLIVCVAGSCRMLIDDGATKESFLLDSPNKGLLVKNLIWREMHDFTPDCVLLVFASEHYDESDYIRNYQDFLRFVNEGKNT